MEPSLLLWRVLNYSRWSSAGTHKLWRESALTCHFGVSTRFSCTVWSVLRPDCLKMFQDLQGAPMSPRRSSIKTRQHGVAHARLLKQTLGKGMQQSKLKKSTFSLKEDDAFCESRFGEDCYRKDNSVKRSGPFSKPLDSESWYLLLIPSPNLSFHWLIESLTWMQPLNAQRAQEGIHFAPFSKDIPSFLCGDASRPLPFLYYREQLLRFQKEVALGKSTAWGGVGFGREGGRKKGRAKSSQNNFNLSNNALFMRISWGPMPHSSA